MKYHFSYDVINYEKDFGSYDEARRYMLCVLSNTGFVDIASYNASTFIIEYDKDTSTLPDYLHTNLSKYFYYSLSLVGKQAEGTEMINHHPDMGLDIKVKKEIRNLDCSGLGKEISNN
ncbi:hypothetical protein [Flavobacterium cerinum]|uniref:Uncharacterized protein n=1 Tax=Flavobacterium cerinum TaxID=2502784 RepID=A0A3S4T1A0_9FLAO|nr:hypothetical protein [Flavobacterium cerinum]RWX00259.1 hypothetical protein EPI11_10300 [Flavobacterium cerinum]